MELGAQQIWDDYERLRRTVPLVHSLTNSKEMENTVREAARQTGTTVVATGATDYLCDGSRLVVLTNGHALLTKVTGTGCVVSAITAAFLGVQPDPLAASVAAVSIMNVAAEVAAAHPLVNGPGSFQVRLLDTLGTLNLELLESRLRLTRC